MKNADPFTRVFVLKGNQVGAFKSVVASTTTVLFVEAEDKIVKLNPFVMIWLAGLSVSLKGLVVTGAVGWPAKSDPQPLVPG